MLRFARYALIILIALSLLIVSAGAGLAEARPFRPGNLLFPLQNFSEQTRAQLIGDQTARALYYLDLASQRASDLAAVAGTKHELPAIAYLSRALDQAAQEIVEAPEEDLVALSTRLVDIAGAVNVILSGLQYAPENDQAAFEAIMAKVQSIQQLVSGLGLGTEALAFAPGTSPGTQSGSNAEGGDGALLDGIDPRQVVFPPGSAGAIHAFFPLEGGHADLDCLTCHTDGQFRGTPRECVACHSGDEPASHFPGDCASCHSPASWTAVTFDHAVAGATNCQSCHNQDKPANHFSGQCSACHNTISWSQATFNHQAAGATDCQNCHSKDKPANHFAGQCSACHNTSNWSQATFNHAAVGATDCQNCHSKDKPSNHFAGQCSACHNTSKWSQATFNHAAVGATDCQSCHSKDKPSNHFAGQCSTCHNTSNWKDATFNHGAVGATDCKDCHSKDKPANHFAGQCSTCHNTSNWKNADFKHGSGAMDCLACHSKDKPSNHFAGQCSDCHNTNSWGDADFNHSFPINHKNADGVCAKCHPSGTDSYTCYTCHDKGETDNKHKEVSGYGANCAKCHPDGKSEDD